MFVHGVINTYMYLSIKSHSYKGIYAYNSICISTYAYIHITHINI